MTIGLQQTRWVAVNIRWYSALRIQINISSVSVPWQYSSNSRQGRIPTFLHCEKYSVSNVVWRYVHLKGKTLIKISVAVPKNTVFEMILVLITIRTNKHKLRAMAIYYLAYY